MKKILVTGADGFVGGNFVHYINTHYSREYQIVACVYNKSVYNNLNYFYPDKIPFDVVEMDITDYKNVYEHLFTYAPDIVYHFAAQAIVSKAQMDPYNTYKVNVLGTMNLLEAITKLKLYEKQFLFYYMSTDKVYGEANGAVETTQLMGNCPYSLSKIAAEGVVKSYTSARDHTIPFLIFRPCNLYGSADFNRRVIPNTIRDLLEGRKPIIFEGDENFYRQYLYITDFCSVLKDVSNYCFDNKISKCFNVAPAMKDSYKSTYDVVLMLGNKYALYMGNSKWSWETRPKKNILEIQKQWIDATSLFRFYYEKINSNHKFVPLEKGLEMTLNWYLNNSDYFKRMTHV